MGAMEGVGETCCKRSRRKSHGTALVRSAEAHGSRDVGALRIGQAAALLHAHLVAVAKGRCVLLRTKIVCS